MESCSATAIIPVHNEEKTIREVIQTVLKSKLFDEIIVVNGGSTDKTPLILKSFGKKIQKITFPCKEGKGQALACGLERAQGKIVIFLDGDAVNLEKAHLLALLNPLRKGEARVAVGWHKAIRRSLSFLEGERAYFRQDLLPYTRRMKLANFGIELFFDELARKKRWKTKHCLLKGLHKILKFDKTGYTQETLKAYLKEALEIAEEAARLYQKTAEEKIAFQRKILQKIFKNYLDQSRKMMDKVLAGSKNFKRLRELLK